jgi:prevent-host-death family protein
MIWQFTDAKRQLSTVVSQSLTDGPQRIQCGEQVVVVVSEDDFDRLCGNRESFGDYLLRVPDLSDLDLSRDQSPMRDVTT